MTGVRTSPAQPLEARLRLMATSCSSPPRASRKESRHPTTGQMGVSSLSFRLLRFWGAGFSGLWAQDLGLGFRLFRSLGFDSHGSCHSLLPCRQPKVAENGPTNLESLTRVYTGADFQGLHSLIPRLRAMILLGKNVGSLTE